MRCSGPTTMMGSTCNTTDGGRPALLLSSSVCNVIEYSEMTVSTVGGDDVMAWRDTCGDRQQQRCSDDPYRVDAVVMLNLWCELSL